MTMGLRTTGRAAKTASVAFEKEITQEDLDSLLSERGVAAPQIVTLRERHHFLARLIAEGKKPAEAASLARYSSSRVSILCADPAFMELVEHYRGVLAHEFVDFNKQLAQLGVDAAVLLQERMEDTPDEVSTSALMQLVTISADRTGHGPSQKTEVNIRVGLADRLAQARLRTNQLRDVTPQEEE